MWQVPINICSSQRIDTAEMAPPMLNSPLIFAEAYSKSDLSSNSLNNGLVRSDANTIKVSTVEHSYIPDSYWRLN